MVDKISQDPAVEQAHNIRPLTQIAERELLAMLAREVPANGLIVEIGTLYGGMTAVLALANPAARIESYDNYSWHPEDGKPSSISQVDQSLKGLNIRNVHLFEQDSREVGRDWSKSIDLAWIDGGHSYEDAYADLVQFGSMAQVIALHDFGNPYLPQIQQAVRDFLACCPKYQLVGVIWRIAVIRKVVAGKNVAFFHGI